MYNSLSTTMSQWFHQTFDTCTSFDWRNFSSSYLSDWWWNWFIVFFFAHSPITRENLQSFENVDANGGQIHFTLQLKPLDLSQNQAKPSRRQIGLSDGENAVTCPPSDRRARRSAYSRSLRRVIGRYRAADRILRRTNLRLRPLRLYFGKTRFRFDNVRLLASSFV